MNNNNNPTTSRLRLFAPRQLRHLVRRTRNRTVTAMTYRYLPKNLPTLLRKAGLTVIEIEGWATRGRPTYTGDFNPVGVLWHHTGGPGNGLAYARWLALDGRSDLPAPLCHLSIDRQGVVYVIAAGRANHAGVAKSSGTVAAGDGNALYIGVEVQNTGSEGWKPAQLEAMLKTAVVLKGVVGTSVQTQRGHKETSVTGKWDPGMLDMNKFRADIAARLVPAKPGKHKPPKGGTKPPQTPSTPTTPSIPPATPTVPPVSAPDPTPDPKPVTRDITIDGVKIRITIDR